jgi:hypothetical protein
VVITGHHRHASHFSTLTLHTHIAQVFGHYPASCREVRQGTPLGPKDRHSDQEC